MQIAFLCLSLINQGCIGETPFSPQVGAGNDTATPILSVSPSSLDLGSTLLNIDTPTSVITLSNLGFGDALSCNTATISGTDAAQFSIVSDGCASTIASFATCSIQVKATPVTVGSKSATLTKSCSTGGTLTVSLSANGTNQVPVVGGDQVEAATEDNTLNFTVNAATDLDLDTLSYLVTTAPANGTLVNCMDRAGSGAVDDRTCSYIPNANFNGADSFIYKVNDGGQDSATSATVTINVSAVNDNPYTAGDQTVSGSEDSSFSFTISQGGDVDGDSVGYFIVGAAGVGTLDSCMDLAGSDGTSDRTCMFQGAANGNGSPYTTFTYKTNDNTLDSATNATVTINVTNTNDTPIVYGNQTFNGTEDITLNFSVATGTDIDGDTLSYVVVTSPANGTLSNCMDQAGSGGGSDLDCTYAPSANYNGNDTFTYKINDGTIDSATNATVSLSMVAVNDSPYTGGDQTINGNEDSSFSFTLVVGGDVDGDTIGYFIVGAPALGTVDSCMDLSGSDGTSDRTCMFAPVANQSATPYTTFTYKTNDNTLDSATNATVTVNISAVNDAPIVYGDQTFNGTEDVTLNFSVATGTDVDGDTLSYIVVVGPSNGTLSNCMNQAGSGSGADLDCTYVPTANYSGTDTFTYKANDGTLDSATNATVSLGILSVNDVPVVGGDQTVNGNEDSSFSFTLNLGYDVETTPLGYFIVGAPALGTVDSCMDLSGSDGTSDRTCMYQGAINGEGTPYTTFTYKVNDNTVDSATNATVTVNLSAVNDAPFTFGSQSFDGTEDTTLNFTVGTGWDAESATLSYIVVNSPSNGTLSNCMNQAGSAGNDDLSCTYVPTSNWNGTDTFTYKSNDLTYDSATDATVSLVITPVNDLPIIGGGQDATGAEDASWSFTLNLGSDIDGDAVGYFIVGAVGLGTLDSCMDLSGSDGTSDRTCMYQGAANGNGSPYTSFTYKVNDNTGDGATNATVNLFVTAVNDAPVISATGQYVLNSLGVLTQNTSYNLLWTATDPDGEALTYTCFFATAGMDSTDQNYSATSDCVNLPSITTSNGVSYVGSASFVSATPGLNWTPTQTQLGTYRISVMAVDPNGVEATASLITTVNDSSATSALIYVNDAFFSKSPGGLGITVPYAPSINASSNDNNTDNWLDMVISGVNTSLANFPANPWSGTGAKGSPYQLDFDGVDSYITIPAGTSLDTNLVSQYRTFSFWHYISPTVPNTAWDWFNSDGSQANNVYIWGHYSNVSLNIDWGNITRSYSSLDSSYNVASGSYNHYAFSVYVFDTGLDADYYIKFFVNGHYVGEYITNGAYPSPGDYSWSHFVGGAPGASLQVGYAPGGLSQFKTFQSYFSATEYYDQWSKTANRYRKVPIGNIVTDSLYLHFDAANSRNGVSSWADSDYGCSSMMWMDIGSFAQEATYFFSDVMGTNPCSGTHGFRGTGTSADPYRYGINYSNTLGTFTRDGSWEGSKGATVDVTGNFTEEFWIKVTGIDFATYGPATLLTDQTRNGLGFNETGHARIIYDYASNASSAVTATSIEDSQWHHLVYVHKGATSRADIYIDGTLDGSDLVATYAAGSIPLNISTMNRDQGIQAQIGEMRVYKGKGLTQSEIRQNCHAHKERYSGAVCAGP